MTDANELRKLAREKAVDVFMRLPLAHKYEPTHNDFVGVGQIEQALLQFGQKVLEAAKVRCIHLGFRSNCEYCLHNRHIDALSKALADGEIEKAADRK